MRKYNKPTVEVVSLKSSESIAKTTFKQIRGDILSGKYDVVNDKYTISQYAITQSVIDAGITTENS